MYVQYMYSMFVHFAFIEKHCLFCQLSCEMSCFWGIVVHIKQFPIIKEIAEHCRQDKMKHVKDVKK